MESKKSPKADLEGKSTMFFMIGIALSLLFVLMVFQYRQAVMLPESSGPLTIIDDGPDIPITVTPVKELTMPEKPKIPIDEYLPPEVVDVEDPRLDTENPFISLGTPDETGIVDIPIDDESAVETVPFILIEKMARPVECQVLTNLDAQKSCFNDWIKQYINENTNYPAIGVQMHLEDRVYVTFIISEKGDVESAEVEIGQYDALNNEALRVIRAMPKFVPGKQHDKPVKMKMTIPVNFKLSR